MRYRHANTYDSRQGTVAVLACFLMIGMLGLVAFAVDLGYMANSQTELQRTADATALAACEQLRTFSATPGTPLSNSTAASDVAAVASQYAALNPVCGSSPQLASNDVVIGYMANPGQQGATINTTSTNSFNAVQITVRRSEGGNGLVPAFFSKIFGQTGEAAAATSTAAFLGNAGGYGIPSTATGPGSGT
ncbi:MAG: pilus assembly protein TadG-related protein, partial [Pirellulales bacterium]